MTSGAFASTAWMRITVLAERFRDEPGKTLADMLRRLKAKTAQSRVLVPETPASPPWSGSAS